MSFSSSANSASIEAMSPTSQGSTTVRAKLLGQRADPFLECVALIGERQLGARIGAGLGDAPGDGLVIGKAHDQAALSRHQ